MVADRKRRRYAADSQIFFFQKLKYGIFWSRTFFCDKQIRFLRKAGTKNPILDRSKDTKILTSTRFQTELRMYPQLIIGAVIMCSAYTTILWSERQVMRKFRFLQPSMRSGAYRLQTDIHNALVALAVCPIISMLIPYSVFLIAVIFHLDMGLVSPFLIIVLSSITLLNPLTTCYFVRPFRRYVLRYVPCIHHAAVGTVSHTLASASNPCVRRGLNTKI